MSLYVQTGLVCWFNIIVIFFACLYVISILGID